MADGYVLSPSDVKVLKELVQWKKSRLNNTRIGQPDDMQDGMPLEIYVAKVPSSGIEGRDGINVSSARCRIYKKNKDDELTAVSSYEKQVFNLSSESVPENSWVLVERDKYGTWWVTEIAGVDEGDSDESGDCQFAKLKSTDCLIATGPSDSVILSNIGDRWRSTAFGGTGSGTADGYLNYLDKSGVVDFWIADGRAHLSVDGLELINCGNGCFTGGPATGHVRDGTDTTEDCEGETFTVCVGCLCCPADGWTREAYYCVSTGTGTEVLYIPAEEACDIDIVSGPYDTIEDALANCGDGGGTVDVVCATNPLNTTYTAKFRNATGAYACLNNLDIPITYSSTPTGVENTAGWFGCVDTSGGCGVAGGSSCNFTTVKMWCSSAGHMTVAIRGSSSCDNALLINTAEGDFAFTEGPFLLTLTRGPHTTSFCGAFGLSSKFDLTIE